MIKWFEWLSTLLTKSIENGIKTIRNDKGFDLAIWEIEHVLPTFQKTCDLWIDTEHLLNDYKRIVYMTLLHPKLQQLHPICFGISKEIIKTFKEWVFDNDYLERYQSRIQYITPLLYRLSNFRKKTDKIEYAVKDMMYDDKFLIGTFHEFALTDLLQKLHPDEKFYNASSYDDKWFGFDAIRIDKKNKITFIDYTKNCNTISKKKEELHERIHSNDYRSFKNSEFAQRLYENKNESLSNLSIKAAVYQVQFKKIHKKETTSFYQDFIPLYLEYYLRPEANRSLQDFEQFRNTLYTIHPV